MIRIGGQAIPRSTLMLITLEGGLVFAALVMASVIQLPGQRSVWGSLADTTLLLHLLFNALVVILSLYYQDLYDLRSVEPISRLSVKLSRALGVSLLVMAATSRVNSALSPRQEVVAVGAPMIMILIVSARLAVQSIRQSHVKHERILLMGSGPVGLRLMAELQHRPDFSYQLVGMLSENEDDVQEMAVPTLGRILDVDRVALEYRVDRIIVSLREKRGAMPVAELMQLKFHGVQIEDPYSLYERVTGRIVLESLSPSWFIFSGGFRCRRTRSIAKRGIDILVSAIGLLLTLPLMLLSAIAILIEDGGPIFYFQPRMGLDAKPFRIYKFRSMRNASANVTPSWTGDHDPRITRVGRYLRVFRLDELPQFLNVLRGDMSLIGPRPEQPYFCKMLEEKIPYFAFRHSVRPGITGWAQVKYGYGATTEDAWRKVELDLFYIKHFSFLLDVAIIFETAKVILFGRGR
jgi:sugar transferase (PEP-CTERM system associated)